MSFHLLNWLPVGWLRGAAELTSGALVAGLWQGVLLCAVVAVVLKMVPKSTAALRFGIWIAVFCVSVAMPFVNLHAARSAVHGADASGLQLRLDPRWSYLLAAVWLLAALYRLGQLLLQVDGLRALWGEAKPVGIAGIEAPLMAGGRRVELCTSSEVDRPSVIGFFAPRILIPDWLFAELSPTELNHIVMHEAEHLRRRDDWINLLQKIGLVLLPLNPALFWIDRRLSTERELACDDGVLKQTSMARSYAESLASIAEKRLESRLHRRFGALALAVTGLKRRRSELGQRIESILGRRPSLNPAVAGGLSAVLIAGVVGSGAALAHAPQLVSFRSEISSPQIAVAAPRVVEAHPAVMAIKTSMSTSPVARAQNVSFHPQMKKPVRKAVASMPKPAPAVRAVQVSERQVVAPARREVFMVTSWEEAPVSRVVVQAPDGKFYLAPYAAVPTQAGWLLVQL